MINIQAGGQTFSAILYDNPSAKEFKKRLPLTITMQELNGNEKYYYFSDKLPANSKEIDTIHTGDLMLYGSDCLVLFYKTFSTSYQYTPPGYIENISDLAGALGKEDAAVTFCEGNPE